MEQLMVRHLGTTCSHDDLAELSDEPVACATYWTDRLRHEEV